MQPYVQAYEVMMKCLIELLLENSGKKDDYKMNELPAKIRLMASSVRGKRPVIEHHQLLTLSLSQSSDLIKNLLLSLKSKGIVQVHFNSSWGRSICKFECVFYFERIFRLIEQMDYG